MWPILFGVLAGAPVTVDPGVLELEKCELDTLSFRTPTEVWLADVCGQLFRSSDGGASWLRDRQLEERLLGRAASPPTLSARRLSALLWRSPEAGVALVAGSSTLRLTFDGGLTWTEGATRYQGRALAVAALDEDVWLCDADGRLRHSTDGGRSWLSQAPPLFGKMGTPSACVALSFSSKLEGLALGRTSLWRTLDAGASWARVKLPAVMSSDRDRRFARVVSEPHRWSIVDLAGRVFRTEDDGTHWAELETNAAPPGDPATVLAQALRTRPLHTPPTSERWPVELVAEGPSARWAVKERAAFVATGQGPWVRVIDLPEPGDGLIMRGDEPLVHTNSGIWQRTRRSWVKGSPADEARWRRATEPPKALGATPLDCLQSHPGSVEITWVEAADLGVAAEGRALLEHGSNEGHLLVSEVIRRRQVTKLDRQLSIEETQSVARRIAIAAFTEEEPSDCEGPFHRALVRWHCAEDAPRELELVTSQCDERPGEVGYARAIALKRLLQTLARAEGGRALPLDQSQPATHR